MTSKERIYAVLEGTSYDRVPVAPIFMAWAANSIGRNYRDFYLDGDVLVQSQLSVTRQFNVDQISAISDPWREAQAYGMEFEYPADGVGKPKGHFIKELSDISKLKKLDFEACPRTKQRIESVRRMAEQVGQTHSVLGWVEGPMAEYADLRDVQTAMMDLFDKPEAFEEAVEVITDNAISFAIKQIEAGADMIGVGDAAASLIGPELYRDLVLVQEKKLFDAIHNHRAKVKLHICGNITDILGDMAKSGADVIDVDSLVSLEYARQMVGENQVLCGNFNPSAVLLQGTREDVAAAAEDCIKKGGDRFILMPGCEVPPATPEENIRAFCPCEGTMIF